MLVGLVLFALASCVSYFAVLHMLSLWARLHIIAEKGGTVARVRGHGFFDLPQNLVCRFILRFKGC